MNYQQWLTSARQQLDKSESPKRDAEILLGYVTGKSRTFILAFSETLLSDEEQQTLGALLLRRQRGEPVAHLTGEREFWSLPLTVSPVTLIPRPDTEILVEHALSRLPEGNVDILDLGTGTGAIALALAHERSDCRVTGIDLIPEAVVLAQHNAEKLSLKNVRFLQGSWFLPVQKQRFFMIVSNPPYIDKYDEHLQSGDVRFEPSSALIAEGNGLDDLESIISHAPEFLNNGGWLLVEHGWKQGSDVRSLFAQSGFTQIETQCDYGGNERVTLGKWS